MNLRRLNRPLLSLILLAGSLAGAHAATTVNVTVRNSRGEVVQPVAAYSFLSRAPDVVAVDQSGMVMAEKISATWILVRLSIQNRVLSDSVQVAVIEPTNE